MRYLLALTLSLSLFGQPKRVDDALLKNAAKSATDGDWLSYGLTPGETRYSPLKLIDASNVKRLGLMWSYEVGDGGGDQEATPLVWNNTTSSSPTGASSPRSTPAPASRNGAGIPKSIVNPPATKCAAA